MMLAEVGQGDLLVTMFWLFILMLWFWLLITVFADLYSDKDESTGAKILWTLFVLLAPYIGVFVYLIARGHGMAERAAKRQSEAEAQFRSYVQETAGAASPADQLAKLADLKASGAITDAEYDSMKAKVVNG
ncbi:MAG: SHOCT domain-containing protein [Acidimicrobiales bacterium]|nr:SHOCT domain-containing protein [Acidimicrobiales bacterium]MCB1013710.1 SHOCT domain-containing protein [Acidimicrobiales bacterium]MCB9371702.1 SHOCT domain-containing protein [Microthrixaceae bacterium]